MVKLSEIKGLIGKMQEPEKPCPEGDECSSCSFVDGFNEAVSRMAEREVTMDKEKLAKLLRKDILQDGFYSYEIAHAIIAALPSLLVAKETK